MRKDSKHTQASKNTMSAVKKAWAQTPKGQADLARAQAAANTSAANAKKSISHTGVPHDTSAACQANLGKPKDMSKARQTAWTFEAAAKRRTSMEIYLQTPEGKANMVKAQSIAKQTCPTKLEKALYKMIEAHDEKYLTEVPFPPYIVDAYVPSCHLALEADGPFHFEGNPFKGTTPKQEAQKTVDRDTYLMEHYGLEVWHFTQEDSR